MKRKNCMDECLSSANNITKGNMKKEFTLKEIKEDFKRNVKYPYAGPTIRQSLLYLCNRKALERPHPEQTTTYKMGLMGWDNEKKARREIKRRLEKIEKRLKSIELKLTSENK